MQLACHYPNSKLHSAYRLKALFDGRKLMLNGNTLQRLNFIIESTVLENDKYHCKIAVVFVL